MTTKSALDEYKDEIEDSEGNVSQPETALTIPSVSEAREFSPEQRGTLAQFYVAQAKVSVFQTAIALTAIRNLELYLELGYEKFSDCIEQEIGMSGRVASEYVSAVETFGIGDRVKQLMEASPKRFLQAAKEVRQKQMEGEILTLSDGTVVSAEEFLAERIASLENSSKKKIKSLETENQTVKAEADLLRKKQANLEKSIQKKDEQLDVLRKSKDIDPDKLLKIKNQREAEKMIDECNASILEALQRIETIPEESRNGALGIYLSRTIATMEISLKTLKMAWSNHIFQGETQE
ncbi:hypothetical protein [Leptospira interrogans]|uniref:hypothetical protein n=1 Tax=Leptospira interrogans TaxID=173 RepID=UPI0002BA5450|nr:hypothetical protein [Leptospira interrogans]EMN54775.1 hypothetical protein LEP1GSC089_2056 [Leptospira interrogans serovar Autumnalis str. LP101]MCR8647674.1 hypothetical protein [Leptospira interrogans serovar Bataviae]OAM83084.1 hypothetical protein A1343_19580 [Leptospira interrogans serovar Bataviae]QOI33595.1 hypothetical protein LeptoLang_04730 [Leptospira interrogans serovar Icterohaemorrhagiae]QOI36881.1 hypothetical protein Lepto1548_00260 [Leptospira interrogans serovar Bataviae